MAPRCRAQVKERRRPHDPRATARTSLDATVRSGEASVATAGHPAPMICRGTTACELPAVETGPPLGAGALGGPRRREAGTVVVRPRDALLLVSDGMFERRDEAVDVSLERLAGHVLETVQTDTDPHSALNRLVELGRPASNDDDATLLLARRL